MEHDEQISPSEARQALASIDRQRGTLADRLRFPSWYVTLQSAAYVVLFVVPRVGSIACGLAVAAVAVRGRQRAVAAIRHDIRAGQVRAR